MMNRTIKQFAILILFAAYFTSVSALAQRVPRVPAAPMRPVPTVPLVIPQIDPIGTLPIPAPVLEPAPVIEPIVIAPAQACEIKSSNDCYDEALVCLSARALEGHFDVEWRGGDPAIVRTYDYSTDQQEQDARDCSTDLNTCMMGGC